MLTKLVAKGTILSENTKRKTHWLRLHSAYARNPVTTSREGERLGKTVETYKKTLTCGDDEYEQLECIAKVNFCYTAV